jgi:biotin carboxyl carrier protein
LKLQIKIDGKTYEAEVDVLEEDASAPADARSAPANATSESMANAGAYASPHAFEKHDAGEKAYRSPVTGIVIKVNVKAGQQIEANGVMLVLEAMKMETSVIAHHAGKVKAVHVEPGDSVKVHQVLVELE